MAGCTRLMKTHAAARQSVVADEEAIAATSRGAPRQQRVLKKSNEFKYLNQNRADGDVCMPMCRVLCGVGKTEEIESEKEVKPRT